MICDLIHFGWSDPFLVIWCILDVWFILGDWMHLWFFGWPGYCFLAQSHSWSVRLGWLCSNPPLFSIFSIVFSVPLYAQYQSNNMSHSHSWRHSWLNIFPTIYLSNAEDLFSSWSQHVSNPAMLSSFLNNFYFIILNKWSWPVISLSWIWCHLLAYYDYYCCYYYLCFLWF